MTGPKTFVIVGEADCEAGRFLDEVQPEARRTARTIEALGANPDPRPETADVIVELVVAVQRSQDVIGYFTLFASAEERQIAESSLARSREALSLYRRWVTP